MFLFLLLTLLSPVCSRPSPGDGELFDIIISVGGADTLFDTLSDTVSDTLPRDPEEESDEDVLKELEDLQESLDHGGSSSEGVVSGGLTFQEQPDNLTEADQLLELFLVPRQNTRYSRPIIHKDLQEDPSLYDIPADGTVVIRILPKSGDGPGFTVFMRPKE